MKKLFLQTFGCQMNDRDSEAVQGLLLERDYGLTDDMEKADVILLNTCSVRQKAEDKIFGRAGKLARIKARRPETVIGILGCMAQEHGAKFFNKIPALDLVCGPGNLHEIPELIERIYDKGRKITAIDRLNDVEYRMDDIRHRSHSIKAMVNIMSGCDHKCTYCIVPMTRGLERSRPSADIVREVETLVERGFKEVTLLGQNVNGYGKKLGEGVDFSDLLAKLDATGIERIRFMTSHPKDAHPKLFLAMAGLNSLCEHLHLPVQSGSNRILRRMKREHTREWYIERVNEYRSLVSDGSLTTDIIVGFPGETDEDFEETLSLMSEVKFDSAYMFKYSPRPGTPAWKLEDDVPEKTKNERLQAVMELERGIIFELNSGLLGRKTEVLFEDRLSEGGKWAARNRQFKKVVVASDGDLLGKIREVEVAGVLNETLLGKI